MKIITFFRQIFGAVAVIGLALLLINANTSEQSRPFMNTPVQTPESRPVHDYNIYAIDLPETIDFAGERVPLEIRDVRERFDRELLVNTYWQSNGLLLIKRAHKFFPIIEPILKKNNIPDDFKYLALIESGLQDVVSPSGAVGFWQFMKNTGKEYGLEVADEVDERYHLEKATQAACEYLKNAKQDMGNWTLAAAAYNAGKTGIRNQINKQKVSNYYDLHFNSETSRYVFRILALKEIMKNPQRYGFNYTKEQLYDSDAVKYLQISNSIPDLATFALEQGINYKILRIYNPWLRDMSLENKERKTYLIKIPITK
ncbi:lytic transglycosylase domain-containing protein [Capnocytophaga catalasegens]|uniref:Murein transglycosylase n=1 Tax=Capnocytophaga catalasegens TaxID=1004260 RepID=A0AAV5AVC2_9FLAO|nr:lytic transglycosylase domain-containing protein [Capnocytophaga catalasegens]GIZ16076.1 murein transglycosylase [Capnocytophaga catalasegens]GJM50235.1 murein transglycosylase [Capnocytophaga catalasegens]GJM53466.1 murein transglycosylase [Capnocytophaga catalasegens]